MPLIVRADQPRTEFEHYSENKRFVFQLMVNKDTVCDYRYLENHKWVLNECYWRVIDSVKKKELYRFQKGYGEWLIECSVYVSNNGMYCVAVNDWPAWGLDSSTMFLTFYSKNKELSSFKSKQILSNFKHIVSTASHYFWHNYAKLSKNEFEIETYDMTMFRFSLKDGSLLSRKTNEILHLNTLRVRGKVKQTNDSTIFSMKIYCVLFGKMPLTEMINFKVDKKYWEKFNALALDKYSGDITICIREGIYIETEQRHEYAPCPE